MFAAKTPGTNCVFQVIDVGYASNIIAMRLTHCGEDGFVMYIPSEVDASSAFLVFSNIFFLPELRAK